MVRFILVSIWDISCKIREPGNVLRGRHDFFGLLSQEVVTAQ
jgi:hypothetical protein